jgi:hypothetical protein
MAPKQVPYRSQPKTAFWRNSISNLSPDDVDPAVKFDLKIDRKMKIATAGSCFAQHIARHLANSGFNYFVTEPGHPIILQEIKKKHNYGTFSARYGNIYTSRQLLQLIQRVYGDFSPEETAWQLEDGAWVDPFRPNIQPTGFRSRLELARDRKAHFAAVRRCFEECDVFVFTLGLTEVWISAEDGAAFPVCPGVKGGVFDDERHLFLNLTVSDVVADMVEFFDRMKVINPRCSFILTVSPVPLIATATDNHVLAATTYSKSVLRVAAEELVRQYENAHYFPSYEVITGNYNRGAYYGPDLREVEEAGVSHVMRLFFKHAVDDDIELISASADLVSQRAAEFEQKTSQIVKTICDEELLAAAK